MARKTGATQATESGGALRFVGIQKSGGSFTWFEDRAWRDDPAFPSFETVRTRLAGQTRDEVLRGLAAQNLLDRVSADLGQEGKTLREASDADLCRVAAGILGYNHGRTAEEAGATVQTYNPTTGEWEKGPDPNFRPWAGPVKRVKDGDVVGLEHFHGPMDGDCPPEALDVAQDFINRGVAVRVSVPAPASVATE